MAGIFNRSCLFKTQPIREEMLWTSLPTTLMKKEEEDWKQGITKGSDKWVSAERKHTNPPVDGDCARHPPSITPPPPHAHYSHVHKCFIISAFIVESLRLKKTTHRTSLCSLMTSLPLFISLPLSRLHSLFYTWMGLTGGLPEQWHIITGKFR